jgi:RTA1 like protein
VLAAANYALTSMLYDSLLSFSSLFFLFIYFISFFIYFTFIINLVLLLSSPPIFCCYSSSHRIARRMKKAKLKRVYVFTPKVTKWLFLCCDIAAFFIQGMGGSIAGSAKKSSQQQLGML